MSRMVFGTPAGYNNPPGGISKSKSEATFRFTRPGPRGRRGGGGDRNATEVAETEDTLRASSLSHRALRSSTCTPRPL